MVYRFINNIFLDSSHRGIFLLVCAKSLVTTNVGKFRMSKGFGRGRERPNSQAASAERHIDGYEARPSLLHSNVSIFSEYR